MKLGMPSLTIENIFSVFVVGDLGMAIVADHGIVIPAC